LGAGDGAECGIAEVSLRSTHATAAWSKRCKSLSRTGTEDEGRLSEVRCTREGESMCGTREGGGQAGSEAKGKEDGLKFKCSLLDHMLFTAEYYGNDGNDHVPVYEVLEVHTVPSETVTPPKT
jgi:hypothetical protein